jgi:hypothetical protein
LSDDMTDLDRLNLGVNKPITEDLTQDELIALHKRIAMHWKVNELPGMSDLQCVRVAETIVNGICIGMNSNQLDEMRIAHYVMIGVYRTMNIKHGGRGVALRMMWDAIAGVAATLDVEDATGDSGGAPSIWDLMPHPTLDPEGWKRLKMPEPRAFQMNYAGNEIGGLMDRVRELEAENERLKAEATSDSTATWPEDMPRGKYD